MELWLYQAASQGWTKVSTHPDAYYEVAWAPDGRRFAMNGAKDSVVQLIPLDRSSVSTFVSVIKSQEPVMDWSPDGSFLLGWKQSGSTGFDIITTPLTQTPVPTLLYSSPGNDVSPRLSPDGRLLAYLSDRTGRFEVYLTRMPDAREQWQVSFDGARALAGFRGSLTWGSDGQTVYYASGDGKLMSAAISDRAGVTISKPMGYPGAPGDLLNLDAAPDGRLVLVSDVSPGPMPLTLIEHWPGLLDAQ